MSNEHEWRIGRREFLKGLGAGAATVALGAGLAGCSSNKQPDGKTDTNAQRIAGETPVGFSKQTDVLIVGTGIAGMSAAIQPLKAGKKVLLIDKMGYFGGESSLSCGFFNIAGSKYQQGFGIKLTIEEQWEKVQGFYADAKDDLDYFKEMYFGQTEWCDVVTQDFGVKWQPLEEYAGDGQHDTMLLPERGIGDLSALFDPFQAGLTALGAEFIGSMRALDFIVDGQGTPLGVRCRDEKDGKIVDIEAKCIVLATGGFSCNQELVTAYLPQQARKGPLTVGSMGEGHIMASSLGGAYNRMDEAANLMSDLAQVTVWGYFGPNVQVTPQGKRFIKEDQSHDSPDKAAELELGYWWTIFDEQLITGSQKWNVEQNMQSNPERLVEGNTLAELAAGMGIEAAVLEQTFAEYDAAVAAGEDPLGKKRYLLSLKAPYYAMKHFVHRYKTHGGLKISARHELLNAKGEPIPNVFMVGSTVADTGSDLAPNAGSGYVCGKYVTEALA
ncbi:MAG: FAD-dependent oxidoreductase [Coriobacteriales bacterium]|jgi:fumarate reductase flavoprotein subunit|nr:FAD-dependent oxidoreductase [Coriobacteriales bacterium]